MINGTAAALGAGRAGPLDSSAVLSVSVVPAALAAAELHEASFANVLVGVIAGLECGLRLERALGADHISRGWVLGGSAGCVGAALAASRVLGIRDDHVHAALGFAATQAAGVQAAGPELGALVSGKAAADGLESALLGKAELIGPPLPLEGRRGLVALVTRSADLHQLVDGLGSSWLIAASVPFESSRASGTFEALSRKLSYGAPIYEVAEMLNEPRQ
jgi:2-methylcitrate dehydratase PrpD